jgi:4-amino-4-deoxy-L-arabinose transferase-like glycosyltransferase
LTYPFVVWLTKQPNSEIPFAVLLYAGLFFLWYGFTRRMRFSTFFGCGLLFGVAMLIRPVAIGIPLVLSLGAWLTLREINRLRRAVLIAALILGSLTAVLPWEAFVYYKTTNVILLSTNGVKSIRDGLTYGVLTKDYRESTAPADVRQVMSDVSARVGELKTTGDIAALLFREFQSHPLAVTKLLLLKIARSWYGTDTGRRELPILLIQMAYLVPISWGAWRTWKLGDGFRNFVIIALLVVFYFWAMTFLALSIVRYMTPVMGLLMIVMAACYPGATRDRNAMR